MLQFVLSETADLLFEVKKNSCLIPPLCNCYKKLENFTQAFTLERSQIIKNGKICTRLNWNILHSNFDWREWQVWVMGLELGLPSLSLGFLIYSSEASKPIWVSSLHPRPQRNLLLGKLVLLWRQLENCGGEHENCTLILAQLEEACYKGGCMGGFTAQISRHGYNMIYDL